MNSKTHKKLLVVTLVVAALGLIGACTTESPTAPAQVPSGPVVFPEFVNCDDNAGGQASFSCEAAPPGFDSPGRLTVLFTNESDLVSDESDEECTVFHWDFGDGRTSSQENPRHTYGVNGSSGFVVSLTVETPFRIETTRQFVPSGCGGTTPPPPTP